MLKKTILKLICFLIIVVLSIANYACDNNTINESDIALKRLEAEVAIVHAQEVEHKQLEIKVISATSNEEKVAIIEAGRLKAVIAAKLAQEYIDRAKDIEDKSACHSPDVIETPLY